MTRRGGKLGRLWRTLRKAWERGGFTGVVARVAAWRLLPDWLAFVHDVDLLVLRELKTGTLRPLPARYVIAAADRSVLEELVACTDTPASVERRRAALSRVFELGASCLTVRDQGELVGYVCAFSESYHLTYDDYGPRTLPIALDERAVYLGNCFIRPQYRMRGLFPQLLAAAVAQRPPGTRFFGHVDVGNEHSFNSHLRLGFVPLRTITCLAILGACFFFQRPFGSWRRSRIDKRAGARLCEQDGVFQLEPANVDHGEVTSTQRAAS